MQIQSLYRTFSPTFNAYTHDGAGRDMYIGYNNGGFWNGRIPPGTPFESSTSMSTRYRIRGIPPQVAPFKYYSDGSGRDSYIIFNSGGLKKETKALKEFKLKDFLRVPEECILQFKPRMSKKGFKSVVYINKSQMENNKSLKKNEKGIIERLYTNEQHKFIPSNDNLKKRFNDTSSMFPSLTEYNQCNKIRKKPKRPEKLLNGIDQINSFEKNKRLNTLVNQKSRSTYLHFSNIPTSPY